MFWSQSASELPALAERAYQFVVSGRDYHKPFLDRWLPQQGVIADVGCGLGRIANVYDRIGRRAIGIDLDFESLTAAHAHHGVTFVRADGTRLPIRDGRLAAYVGLGVIEFDGVGGTVALREAHRALRPGGIVYLTVAFRNVWRRKTGRVHWHGFDLPSFTEDEARRLLDATGFDVQLTRRSSLAWGLGPLRRVAPLLPGALVREDETSWSYRLLFPLLRPAANTLLVIGRKRAT
jgi:SAM-dependent methyltransferase